MQRQPVGFTFPARQVLGLLATIFFLSQCHAQTSSPPESGHFQWGIFGQGGFTPAYKVYFPGTPVYSKVELNFYNIGLEAGRQTRWFGGPGPLRGRGEALVELMPFWLGRYPPQTYSYFEHGKPIFTSRSPATNFHGASVTPFLLRWNFGAASPKHFMPWAQLGGGLLWTNHKFPISGTGTSVVNFTPQVGIGTNVFRGPRRSFDFGVKAVHISNAGLGDHNPGLNVTLQFSAGYSWWK